ncbi:MAG: PEP-CTERM sorting domain-containing protein [Planctomycetota bacterium]|nr:PEP-CTERM sorting domain-containing protein [Planctomycetota bacterium]RLS25903.1 MAG: PEP-CTERM sorting domain-containing protein [Planctomycetota bacterium]
MLCKQNISPKSPRSAAYAFGRVLMLAFMIPPLLFQQETSAANLLINGDFEAAPILGPGQSDLAVGNLKFINTSASDPNSISGISGWVYATPLWNGYASDHGLYKGTGILGSSSINQVVDIHNWNRKMSQTVITQQGAGDSVSAEIDFETFESDSDGGRAGTFYLVAGEADSTNQDLWSSRSIILAQLKVANPTFQPGTFNPDVTVLNRQPVHLQLNYTFAANDPALNLPLTIGFRTEWSSVGPTFWDNASLQISSVPEPSTYAFGLIAAGAMAWVARRRKRHQPGV